MSDSNAELMTMMKTMSQAVQDTNRNMAGLAQNMTLMLERQSQAPPPARNSSVVSKAADGNQTALALFAVTVTMVAAVAMNASGGVEDAKAASRAMGTALLTVMDRERADRIAGDFSNEATSSARHIEANSASEARHHALRDQQQLSRKEIQAQLERVEKIIDVIPSERFRLLSRANERQELE